ncbi:hypothetical protein [Streptomyces mashuensis]|nr:hypothetical protein [Streptomyces mashuensis]
MGIVDKAVKTAGQVRDTAHATLGGKNASGLDQKIVTAKGHGEVEVKVPPGYIVTGGGYSLEPMGGESVMVTTMDNRPLEDGSGWSVAIAPKLGLTVYAVCIRDDG